MTTIGRAQIQATINDLPVEVDDRRRPSSTRRARFPSTSRPCASIRTCDATAACGMCIVRVAGSSKMLRACCTPVEQDMEITTEDPEIIQVRRTVIEMILSKHPNECLTCGRNQNCELQTLAADFGLREICLDSIVPDLPLDDYHQGRRPRPAQVHHLRPLHPGLPADPGRLGAQLPRSAASTPASPRPATSRWPSRRACAAASAPPTAPPARSSSTTNTQEVWDKLLDPDTYCVAQLAPAVRVAIGEAFGFPVGTNLTGKIYAALRRMGFKAVFDTNFGADLTIMEEAHEFVERFANAKSVLPLITTCCPSWVDFMEKFHDDMIPHFSSCKSPQAMVGALAKTYYAEKMGLDPAKIYVVSIMPCTAKKFEIIRSKEMTSSGLPGRRRLAHHARAGPHDQAVRHRLPQPAPRSSRTTCWARTPARARSSAPPAASWRRRCAPPTT